MGRSPCCSKEGLNRGAWTAQEDKILRDYVNVHGQGKWRNLPQKAGLKRCGKSCRLRWLNYLRPDIKRGNISPDEEELIIRLHKLLGNKWSLIAGRLPGRTDNEIKNYWNTNLGKKVNKDGGNNSDNTLSGQGRQPINETKPPQSTCSNNNIMSKQQDSHVIHTKASKCSKLLFLDNNPIPPLIHSSFPIIDEKTDLLLDFEIGEICLPELLINDFTEVWGFSYNNNVEDPLLPSLSDQPMLMVSSSPVGDEIIVEDTTKMSCSSDEITNVANDNLYVPGA